MKLSDFKYKVPEKLIAQYPTKRRGDSRLMVLYREDQRIEENHFKDILNFLEEGDCLVVNETRVFPARLTGIKDKTNAEVEIFLLRDRQSLWRAGRDTGHRNILYSKSCHRSRSSLRRVEGWCHTARSGLSVDSPFPLGVPH